MWRSILNTLCRHNIFAMTHCKLSLSFACIVGLSHTLLVPSTAANISTVIPRPMRLYRWSKHILVNYIYYLFILCLFFLSHFPNQNSKIQNRAVHCSIKKHQGKIAQSVNDNIYEFRVINKLIYTLMQQKKNIYDSLIDC